MRRGGVCGSIALVIYLLIFLKEGNSEESWWSFKDIALWRVESAALLMAVW